MLEVNRKLFDIWHASGVNYCHWKSNNTLSQSINGENGYDLDIYVQRSHYLLATSGLINSGFIRLTGGLGKSVDGVEGYLGYDSRSGRYSYIHLHYRLVTGPDLIKGFILPFENEIISTRYMCPDAGVYRPDDRLELLMHYMRASLKVSKFTVFLERASSFRWFSGKWIDQDVYLRGLASCDEIIAECSRLLGQEAKEKFVLLLESKPKASDLLSFRKIWLKRYATSIEQRHPVIASLSFLGRRLIQIIKGILKKIIPELPVLPKKKIPHTGVLVAFVGADGAGKSTVIEALHKDLSWKLEVHKGYLGGLGGAFMLSSPIFSVIRLLLRRFIRSDVVVVKGKSGGQPSKLRLWVKTVWAFILLKMKRRVLGRMWRARNSGFVVLADRFPQSKLDNQIDGPLTVKLDCELNQAKKMKRFEREFFDFIEGNQPDLIIYLDVDESTAAHRLNSKNIAQVRSRISATKRAFYSGKNTVVVDANRHIDEVLHDVKNIVWSLISGQANGLKSTNANHTSADD